MAPFISVVVPVRNEAGFIERVLDRLVAQDYDPQRFEILVVDGQSTDATPSLVQRFAERHENVRLLHNPRRLSSAARNVGVHHSRGELVVIVDGHCQLEDDQYLNKLADAFDRSQADCLGRPQPLDVAGATALQRAIAAARSSWLGHHPDSHIYSSQEGFVPAKSVAVAYRRSVFERVGGFDESFDACEDVELNHRIDRAGLKCFFTPTIALRYAPRASLGGLFRQMVRYGRGRVRLLRKHPETASAGSFLPVAFLLGLVIGLPVSCLSPWLMATYLGVLAVYAAAVLLTSACIALRARDLRMLPLLPAAFGTVHLACAVGVLAELTRLQPKVNCPCTS